MCRSMKERYFERVYQDKGKYRMIRGKRKYTAALAVAAVLALTGCAQGDNSFMAFLGGTARQESAPAQSAEPESALDDLNRSGIYDSEDAAVVVRKDLEAGTVQFQNIASSRRYTLSYDGTTTIYDKNDQALSMEQLKEGSVVTVRFYKPRKALAYVKENPDCISYRNVSNYQMDLHKGTITIGNELYNISGHVVVVSGGRETDMMEVNQMDVLSVWGYKNMIYGVNVEKGHGYLRLQNEDYFVNGWIDVGDSVIRKVASDMLLVVPEGTHTVTVSHKGSSATQEITFARNEEMAWDLGDVEITVVQRGTVIFTLTPATAKVFIDGKEVDASRPVSIEYGLHQMRITADGYDTVAQYIKVAEPSANVAVELEKSEEETAEQSTQSAEEKDTSKKASDDQDEEEDEEDEEEAPASKKYQSSLSQEEEDEDEEENEADEKKSDVVSSTSKYKVYIDAPDGVEAYLDGNYVGITPISFNKVPGSYVVTLRKAGYQTRSYTLQIDSEEKDVNYSFTELMKLAD
ncbi:MAG: PEGA domain-containing protein, partial [Lachnospiraceae bacterium]|nr:PEGA domain-containing protein [Lachnospiraceae bacterium]